jgi:hypothetical protein
MYLSSYTFVLPLFVSCSLFHDAGRLVLTRIFASRLVEVDSTACEVEFDAGILGQTISLTDAGTWVGDVNSNDNASNDDATSC